LAPDSLYCHSSAYVPGSAVSRFQRPGSGAIQKPIPIPIVIPIPNQSRYVALFSRVSFENSSNCRGARTRLLQNLAGIVLYAI
jgi:hypothetical protein